MNRWISREVYERALAEGSAEVMYGRVMLVGPAGVGKSCFKKGLMGLPFDQESNSTIVADVHSVTPKEQPFRYCDKQRPLNHKWFAQAAESWCEVTEDDEMQEIAQLLVLVGQNDLITGASNQFFNETSTYFESSMWIGQILEKAFDRATELNAGVGFTQMKPRPFFHLWDCGGQPVFLELLPIFLTSRTIFLLFFNAATNLTQPWESSYRTGKEVASQGKVNMSTLDMMHRWIALISSHLFVKKKDPGYPRVIPIGTRGDKLGELEKQSVLREVEDSIKGKAPLHHVLKQPVIIDNTTSGTGDKEDPGYKRVREEISDITQSKLIKDTPLSWILFRKLFQSKARSQNTDIMSLDDVHVLARLAKVQSHDVEYVLCFYHELGVLLYYPNIKGLEQKVILNPRWFVECLGKILALPGAAEERYEDKVEWELFRTKGILVQRLYTNVWSKCQGVQPEEFMELLIHFQLAVQVKVERQVYFDEHSKKYFVPSVLPYFSQANDRIPGHCHNSFLFAENSSIIVAAPLHVTFHAGFVIPGFFTRFAIAVLKDRDNSIQKIGLCFKKNVFHNLIRYEMQSLPSHYLVLTEHANSIEISFTCPSIRPLKEMQKCCVNLKALCEAACEDVKKLLTSLHDNITESITSYELRVVCQAKQCSDQGIHYLTPDSLQENVRTFVKCERNDELREIITREAYWYQESNLPLNVQASESCDLGDQIDSASTFQGKTKSQLNSRHNEYMLQGNQEAPATHCKPVLRPQLVNDVHRLLNDIAVDWNDIGRELGVDWEYREELRREPGLTNAYKLESVLHKWAQSECSDVNWDTIIDVLERCQKNNVLRSVKDYLLNNSEAVRKYAWTGK